jgi:hypothetical protein
MLAVRIMAIMVARQADRVRWGNPRRAPADHLADLASLAVN